METSKAGNENNSGRRKKKEIILTPIANRLDPHTYHGNPTPEP